jgi:CheY-like chemotaxis protein/GAF domain-containing protein/PAS domain-containing protein
MGHYAVTDRLRILVLGEAGPATAEWLRRCQPDGETVKVASWLDGLERLGHEHFDLVLTNPDDAQVLDSVRRLLQSRRVLGTLPDGIALVKPDRTIHWANPAFEAWCEGSAVGRDFYEALGTPRVTGAEKCPFRTALDGPRGQTIITRLECRCNRYLELQVTPISESDGEPLLVALGRDITAIVQQQRKLDALYKAGRELAALSPDHLAEMSAEERVELLKLNIRRFTRDVLHYDVVEVRLLDRQTNRLELLLQEGMIPEAANRSMLAAPQGQGVTGHVAATGKSYLCPDTAADPLYMEGSPGARSSLTVPLIFQDQVVGTFNVESPQPNAFGESDRQFLELFGQEIAAGLHTLELLSAEQRSSATQSIEAISREVVLPVDDILAAATSVLERYIGHDPEIADKLRKILAGARSIKACIQQVGEKIAPAPPAASTGTPAPPSLKGLRVLVADNDDRVRRSAHSLLGRWGCVVETARDAHEAITMARLGNYDALLADIRLPDLSGYEVYRGLREAAPKARVVLMTGYGYDPSHSLVKARQDGLRHVLFKPFRVDQLLDALAGPAPGETDGKGPSSSKDLSPPHSTLVRIPGN